MKTARTVLLWLTALLGVVACTETVFAQQSMPKSGALVALNTGQTLWIAPVNGKMQVVALDDYVIPRKDGFWRVRLQPNSLPPEVLAVPLGKDKDQVLQKEKAPTENKTSQDEGQDQSEAETPVESNAVHRQEVRFLSTNYISVYTESEQYEASTLLKIWDARPGENSLVFIEEKTQIPEDVRAKDVKPCVDPKNEDATYQEYGSQQASFGIVRGLGSWRYDGVISLRGYSTDCGVSLLPPKSMVAQIDLFPAWKKIKDVYPDAEDAFTSPAHDMLLVFYRNRLMVSPLRQSEVGKPLLRLEVNGKPVMVEWALGRYVDAWTKQLTPYFGVYRAKAGTSQ